MSSNINAKHCQPLSIFFEGESWTAGSPPHEIHCTPSNIFSSVHWSFLTRKENTSADFLYIDTSGSSQLFTVCRSLSCFPKHFFSPSPPQLLTQNIALLVFGTQVAIIPNVKLFSSLHLKYPIQLHRKCFQYTLIVYHSSELLFRCSSLESHEPLLALKARTPFPYQKRTI